MLIVQLNHTLSESQVSEVVALVTAFVLSGDAFVVTVWNGITSESDHHIFEKFTDIIFKSKSVSVVLPTRLVGVDCCEIQLSYKKCTLYRHELNPFSNLYVTFDFVNVILVLFFYTLDNEANK